MLRSKSVSLLIFIVLLLVPMIGLAQDMPHGKWWRSQRAAKHLDLTEEETARLDEKFVESRRKLIDLKSNVERQQFELDNLLESEVLDEAAMMEQFKKLETARADLSTERFSFLLQVRHILGFERFLKIKALQELRRQKKGQKGHRPPGGDVLGERLSGGPPLKRGGM
jgi:Spy/CpxP family protein refolding chaperone